MSELLYFTNPRGIRFGYTPVPRTSGNDSPTAVLARDQYSVTVAVKQLFRWKYQDELIQDVFPGLTLSDREFLITGLTPMQQSLIYKDSGVEGDYNG